MRFARRRPPRLNPQFLVQTAGVERLYRSVPAFTATTLSGEVWSSRSLSGSTPTLMVFVKDNCTGCAEFIDAAQDPKLAGLVDQERLILVVGEDDKAVQRRLARAQGVEEVLIGAQPARALRVPGAPFFSLISASGDEVVSEGVAFGVSQVRDHCRHGLAGNDQSVPRLELDE